jgi:hypothetical protein
MTVVIKRLFYRGTSSGGGATDAQNVSYNNTTSGLPASNVQEAIDELANNSGSSGEDYSFVNGTWLGPNVDGNYYITINFTTHNKENPTISVFETSGSNFVEVETQVTIDSSNNVIISVPSSPDLRFSGKIIII